MLPDSEVPIGLSLLSFVTFLGGSVFITAAQTLLETRLFQDLKGIIPNLDPTVLANSGAASLRTLVSAEQLPMVLDVFNRAIRLIWYLALALSCLIFVASLGLEWKSVKKEKKASELVA